MHLIDDHGYVHTQVNSKNAARVNVTRESEFLNGDGKRAPKGHSMETEEHCPIGGLNYIG